MSNSWRSVRMINGLCALAMLCFASTLGCGEGGTHHAGGHDHGHEHDHDHADRPDSLHEAVRDLTKMRDEIRDAILDGDPEDAHDPLHEVGELLEVIPDVAAETDLAEEDWDAVKEATEQLFDAFGKIDKTFHVEDGDKEAAYEEVSDQLDEAIEAIRSRLPLTGEDPEEVMHHDLDGHSHHDEHEHDEHDHHDEDSSEEDGEE